MFGISLYSSEISDEMVEKNLPKRKKPALELMQAPSVSTDYLIALLTITDTWWQTEIQILFLAESLLPGDIHATRPAGT
ncbi:MAG: hypothetical protein JKP90_02405 [Desulfofustis sp. PB-SRB1]|nr:hypothetical protein [Desulfofustis sp. PB-SRB1]